MTHRTLAASLLLIALGCATADTPEETDVPQFRYSGQPGARAVGVIPEGTIRDEARKKDVVFAVDYPQSEGAHPLVLFSPAYGASHRDYVGLSSNWASHGYVVMRLSHADSASRGELVNAVNVRDQRPSQWQDRARDIAFLLDALDALEQKYPELKGKIDRTKIGAAGHGYGAYTATLLGGVRTFPGGTSYSHPAVKAVIAMSPQGPTERLGLTAESFATLTVPTLFISGTAEEGLAESETPEWRRQPFVLSPAGDKWQIVIDGAGSASYSGRVDPNAPGAVRMTDRTPTSTTDPLRSEPSPRGPGRESGGVLRERGIFSTIRAMSLAFWDTYLRADAEGRTALEGAASRGGLELEKK